MAQRFSFPVGLVVVLLCLLAGCAPDASFDATLGDATSDPDPGPSAVTTMGPALPLPTFTPEPVAGNPTPASRPIPPKKGNRAVDFTLPDLQGTRIRLSDWRGKKVMLNFWATWCGPCRIEIPFMVKLYREMQGQDFEIVAVNLREDANKVAPFVDQYEMTFTVLLDTPGQVAAAYYVRAIPTSIFIDEEGIIQDVHIGTLTEKMLRDYVKRLMD